MNGMNTPKPSRSTLARQRNQAAGLCRECGEVPPQPDKTRCQKCIKKDASRTRPRVTQTEEQKQARRIWRRERRHKCITDGICPDCLKRPAKPGAQRCEQCLDNVRRRLSQPGRKHNTSLQLKKQRARRRQRRLAAGCCVACGKPAKLERTRCELCLQKESKRHKDKAKLSKTILTRRNWHSKLRQQVIAHYTNGTFRCMCPKCPIVGIEFLTLDHVDNDGNTHREKVKGGVPFYRWCIKNNFPASIQVLCWSCNCAKQYYGNGTCPHNLK